MNRKLVVTGVLLIGALTLAVGCSSYSHISGESFAEKMKFQSESMHDVSFIGCASDRAYLSEWKYWPVFGERTSVYWTSVSALPKGAAEKLYRGEPPYTSHPPVRNGNQ